MVRSTDILAKHQRWAERALSILITCGLLCAPGAWRSAHAEPSTADRVPHAGQAHTILARLMACGGNSTDSGLDALRNRLHEQDEAELAALAHAFERARRSSRLPEVVRFKTRARFDRDKQKRLRLTENYDDVGAIQRSALEDRDTYQNDGYITVSLSAEWRLSRTHWSKDEIALRREQTKLRDRQRDRRRNALKTWFSLQHIRLRWCVYREQHPQAAHRETASSIEYGKYQKFRLDIHQYIATLNDITGGWFVATIGGDLPAHSSAHEHSARY